jgi:hypothetical protein
MGKSLYIIASINSDPTPIHAYDIQPSPNYLAFQSEHGVPRRGSGGVGLAIDSDSGVLFVTYESSNIIELINATTMNSTGNAEAPGAWNLAGIVYDRYSKRVYTIDRNTNHLYVYSWDFSTQNLSLEERVNLSGVLLAHGLAIDEPQKRLYVGDMVAAGREDITDNIKVFSTKTWEPVANYTVNQSIQGIAIDVRNQFVYTGHSHYSFSKGWLVKLDLNTMEETSVSIQNITGMYDDTVVGIAVDSDTGLVYITTGNQGSLGYGPRLHHHRKPGERGLGYHHGIRFLPEPPAYHLHHRGPHGDRDSNLGYFLQSAGRREDCLEEAGVGRRHRYLHDQLR